MSKVKGDCARGRLQLEASRRQVGRRFGLEVALFGAGEFVAAG